MSSCYLLYTDMYPFIFVQSFRYSNIEENVYLCLEKKKTMDYFE